MRITALLSLCALSTAALADTAIETETAQIGSKGDIAFSQSVEFANGRDGESGGTLTQFEYGISDRAELLIEPFFYLWEKPDGEERTDGRGDLEITPSYMFVKEDGMVPAMLFATKVKVPTGSRQVGGTKKYDFFPYFILGQHYAEWTFNANLGVNFARPEEGGSFDRTFVWDVQTEHGLWENLAFIIEAFNSEEDVDTVSTALEYKFGKHFNAFLAVGYTEEHETIVRPGFNLEFY